MKKAVKICIGFLLFLLLVYILMWISSRKTYAVTYGISFNENHAASLGLDWKETYLAMFADLKPKTVRVAAMWSDIERVEGEYDFSRVDFMLDTAFEHGSKIVLVVGQKAPRWPECHVPDWIDNYNDDEAKKRLLNYVKATVGRYHDHPALEYWQVENEAFIHFKFGECERFQQSAVKEELDLVRAMDAKHPIIMTDSGELSTWRKPSKLGDVLGTTLYRVVQTPSGKTITYDWLPPAFYKWKARLLGKKYEHFFVAELQAEPWFTDSDPTDTPVDVQEQTMNPDRMKEHIEYAEKIGASRAYLWGVEWWYFMKQEHNDSRYWEVAKNTLNQ